VPEDEDEDEDEDDKSCAKIIVSVVFTDRVRKLQDAIAQFMTLLEPAKILDEMFDDFLCLVEVPASGVRRDITVLGRPERVIGRQRFGFSNIQVGSA